MTEIDRSSYSDVMVAFENSVAEKILDTAHNIGLEKLETVSIVKKTLDQMKTEIRNEKTYSDKWQLKPDHKVAKTIISETERWSSSSGVKKIEAYIVLENVLTIMQQELDEQSS